MEERSQSENEMMSGGGSGVQSCSACGAPATLQCPKCKATFTDDDRGVEAAKNLKWTRADSVFCSQECFRAQWKTHRKRFHAPPPPTPTTPSTTAATTSLSGAQTSSSSPDGQPGWGYAVQQGVLRVPQCPNFPWTGTLRPALVGPLRSVPRSIRRPDWATTGRPRDEETSRWQRSIPVLQTPEELRGIREACVLAREVLDMAAAMVKPGVTCEAIDKAVHDMAVRRGAYPSPLNYYGFPKSCCTSVNEVVCHGIPDLRPLEEGDIVNVDITVFLNGFHGDINETFAVGEIDDKSKTLVQGAYDCLVKAITAVKPGMRFRDLGDVISAHARANKLSVVRSYCGHGIGRLFHCMPSIPHYAGNKAAGVMKPGMVFTIEPMINGGDYRDVTWPDGWTAVTRDGKRSAQFEHTMIVTETGVDVLTKRLETSPPLFCVDASSVPVPPGM